MTQTYADTRVAVEPPRALLKDVPADHEVAQEPTIERARGTASLASTVEVQQATEELLFQMSLVLLFVVAAAAMAYHGIVSEGHALLVGVALCLACATGIYFRARRRFCVLVVDVGAKNGVEPDDARAQSRALIARIFD
jgi:hypothetical protein